jgi:hypothetical protein
MCMRGFALHTTLIFLCSAEAGLMDCTLNSTPFIGACTTSCSLVYYNICVEFLDTFTENGVICDIVAEMFKKVVVRKELCR